MSITGQCGCRLGSYGRGRLIARGPACRGPLLACCQVDDFAGLTPGGIRSGLEGAISIAAQDAVRVGGFYVLVEGRVNGHVIEGGGAGAGVFEAGGIDAHFGYLAPCDVIVGLEGAISVAADDSLDPGRFDVDVEGVVAGHVAEVLLAASVERDMESQYHHFYKL